MVGLVGTGFPLGFFTLEDATHSLSHKCRQRIATTPCVTARTRAVLNPHILPTHPSCSPCSTPRHQSVRLPCQYEVPFTTLPHYCCMVNIAFVYTLWQHYFIHTQLRNVIQLWFMHDRHLNFFRCCYFNPVHTNITYLTNKGFINLLKPNNVQGVTGGTDQTSGGCSLC